MSPFQGSTHPTDCGRSFMPAESTGNRVVYPITLHTQYSIFRVERPPTTRARRGGQPGCNGSRSQPASPGSAPVFHISLHFDRLPGQFCRLLERLPGQFCRLLERLAGHYTEQWSAPAAAALTVSGKVDGGAHLGAAGRLPQSRVVIVVALLPALVQHHRPPRTGGCLRLRASDAFRVTGQ